MLTVENLVGKQEDWASYITNVEMREQPFLDWLPVGNKPVNPLYDYQAEKFRTPRKNSHVDGKPWEAFNAAGDNRGRLKALVQWLDNTTSVSKLTQDVTQDAAVEDQLAYDIPKSLKEMGSDAEVNMLDDHDGREDNKVEGYLTRSAHSWLSPTAQGLYPVPEAFRPPAASIVAGTTVAAATEDTFRDLMASQWRQCKSKEPLDAFLGESLKRKFSDFQFYLPTSAATQASGVNFQQSGKDGTIIRSVDHYQGDFMPVRLILTPWHAGLTGTATKIAGRGLFLHRSKWELRWNQKPKVYRPEFKGGSYEAAMDMILMLVCKNQLGEGEFNPN